MNLFTLSAELSLNKKKYEEGLTEAESEAYAKGQAIGTGLRGIGGAFGTAIAGMAKITAVGIAAASTAAGAIVKKSISEYSEYEQTLGGVKKLYGAAGMSVEEYAKSVGKSVNEVKGKYSELTKAQDIVLKNAQEAYKTAGMSTQQYMEQATSFSAALINSLGGDTVKAAEQTDVAMRAISDNYNTFGGDMQNIQNAFQGFAKGNYMMLDNLKLGYGGTKGEMQRLIDDANEYAASIGQAANLSIDSFSDIVSAIELVQEKQGIAGTTAREAASTISGSLGMVKSAWGNLITGLSDPDADLSTLIDNVVNSIVGYTDSAGNRINGFLDNIIPAIQRATQGLVKLIGAIAPKIAENLPALINDVLPMLIQTGIELLNGLIAALPTFMQVLFDQLPLIITSIVDAVINLLPMIVELGFNFIEALIQGITEAIPQLLPKLTEVILKIAEFFKDPQKLTDLVTSAVTMIQQLAIGLIEALPQIIPALVQIITGIVIALTDPNNIMKLLEAAVQIMLAIAEGLLKAIPILLEAIPQIIMNLLEAIIMFYPTMLEAGKEFLKRFISGLLESKEKLVLAIKELMDGIKNKIKERIDDAKKWGKDLIQNFIDGIKAKWEALKQTVKNVAQTVKDFLGFSEPKEGPLSNFHTYAPDMMDLFMQGINDNKGRLISTVADAFDFEKAIVKPYDMDVNGVSTGTEGNGGGNVYNININQPVDTADNLARVIREEAQYGLIGGDTLAY